MSLAIRTRSLHSNVIRNPFEPKDLGMRPAAFNESRLERLVKLVPADVVGVYLAAVALGSNAEWYLLTVIITGTVLVPLLLAFDARSSKETVPMAQYVVRTLAFVVWALVIKPPFSWLDDQEVAGLLGLLVLVLPVVGERVIR